MTAPGAARFASVQPRCASVLQLIAAYGLAFAGLVLLGGRFADRYAERRGVPSYPPHPRTAGRWPPGDSLSGLGAAAVLALIGTDRTPLISVRPAAGPRVAGAAALAAVVRLHHGTK